MSAESVLLLAVADVVQASGGTVSRHLVARHLASVRLGGRVYCRASDVEQVLGAEVASRAAEIARTRVEQ